MLKEIKRNQKKSTDIKRYEKILKEVKRNLKGSPLESERSGRNLRESTLESKRNWKEAKGNPTLESKRIS